MNLKYITKEKNEMIKLSLKYKKHNKKENKIEEIDEKYDLKVISLLEGNDLAKLILDEYLNKFEAMDKGKKKQISFKISNIYWLYFTFCRSWIIRKNFRRNEKANYWRQRA